MTPHRPRYLAYMLRLWQAGDDEEPSWRVSLESPHTGERHGFAGLAQLVAFLEEQTEAAPHTDPEDFENL
jgi:hypothetical protein